MLSPEDDLGVPCRGPFLIFTFFLISYFVFRACIRGVHLFKITFVFSLV